MNLRISRRPGDNCGLWGACWASKSLDQKAWRPRLIFFHSQIKHPNPTRPQRPQNAYVCTLTAPSSSS